MNKKRILLIDDEKDILHFTKLNLEHGGEFEVTTAENGEDGLKKAAESIFDLVITDFRMPGIDGQGVLDALKARTPPYPVILFSIYHDDNDTITQSVLQKADGIVSKPINREELYKKITEVLAKVRA